MFSYICNTLYTTFNHQNFDLSKPIDLSIAITGGQPQVNAFHIPFAEIHPLRLGDFVGSVEAGGPVNCYDVKFNPHGNGTHTECVGHISKEHHSVNQCLNDYFMMAVVVSVGAVGAGFTPAQKLEAGRAEMSLPPLGVGGLEVGRGKWKEGESNDLGDRHPELVSGSELGDLLIHPNDLKAAIEKYNIEDCSAIIIRTMPNPECKRTQQHSGNNPTYFHPDCMDLIIEKGFKHLLTDLPSVDREEDGGALLAHHRFWDYPSNPRLSHTITELIYVPDNCADGIYLLNLQVAAMESDASPSRPVLYPMGG